nr:hypothetical protein [Tanacetum cinerariifolium]
MIAILEKYEQNVDFHPIVDFVEASHLRVNNPSFSGRTVPLFDSMLVPQGEGSGTPTEPHHAPTSEASQSSPYELSSPSLPPVITQPIPTVIHTELTALCTSLQRQQTELVSKFKAQELKITSLKAKIKLLKDKDGGVAEQSGDDASIKGRSLESGEEIGA